MDKSYDVFGVGSPLLDLTFDVDEKVLDKFELLKGTMSLVGEEQSREILNTLESYERLSTPGGSASNTIAGVGMLGGKAVFAGKIGDDEHGEIYEKETVSAGVLSRMGRQGGMRTGHAIALITPDGERTFVTHLGASQSLSAKDISADDVASSRILHLEGYLLEGEASRDVLRGLMMRAKKNDTLISIDLNDAGIITRHRETIMELIEEYVDILFVNEYEAEALTGNNLSATLEQIAAICPVVAIKVGSGGSLVRVDNNTYVIPPYPVSVENTNGAGDMYAGGLLYALSRGIEHGIAAHVGSFAASRVVREKGARLSDVGRREVVEFINVITQ